MYVKGSISEMDLGNVVVGSTITGTAQESGTPITAEITEISKYPSNADGNYYGGDSNPNASSYPFTAYIEDSDDLINHEYVDIQIEGNGGNGSSVYLPKALIRMENGQSYDAALREAQRLGYAEADPAADVEGLDAGRKICILAGLAFGKNVAPDRISVEGITKITALDAAFAAAGGMKLRLLGRAVQSENGLFVFVSPHFVPETQLLAGIGGVNNAVEICGSEVGRVQFAGPGAGRYPTASAVLGDVIELAGNPGRQRCAWSAEPARLAPLEDFKARWFVRTKERRGAVEERLGAVRWLPAQMGWQGGFTEKLPRRALSESGLRLEAVFPVREL